MTNYARKMKLAKKVSFRPKVEKDPPALWMAAACKSRKMRQKRRNSFVISTFRALDMIYWFI